MAYSHCTGKRLGTGTGIGTQLMGPSMLYRNVHTGPRPGKEPGSIVSYCANPVPCSTPGPVPVRCE